MYRLNIEYGPILEVLRVPGRMAELPPLHWDTLIRVARRCNLLGRLAYMAEERELLDEIPPPAREHLASAAILSEKHEQTVKWELDRVENALRPLGVPVVLLKGAAYLNEGLPCARGRLFSDIDIMVPRTALERVERMLVIHGWTTAHHNTYDQKYYRKWMHELPPMRHIRRKTYLDVHHAIVPVTSRLRSRPDSLFARALRADGQSDLRVLSPDDMVLHSATHLFSDGELEQGLRDLVDIDDLLRSFSGQDGFWLALVERSRELNLARPLYYALRYAQRLLGTPVPEHAQRDLSAERPIGAIRYMDALFVRGLAPDHPLCDDWFSGAARWQIYVRSHYLRMPFYLLLPHLLRKTFRSEGGGQER